MIQIGAGDFKAHCLKLIDQTRQTGETIIITKRGKPIVKIIPYDDEPFSLDGFMKGTVTITGNIIEPLDVEWNEML